MTHFKEDLIFLRPFRLYNPLKLPSQRMYSVTGKNGPVLHPLSTGVQKRQAYIITSPLHVIILEFSF